MKQVEDCIALHMIVSLHDQTEVRPITSDILAEENTFSSILVKFIQ